MRKINSHLVIILLTIIGLTTAAQAGTASQSAETSRNLFYSSIFTGAGNKYCPNAEGTLTDANIDEIIQIHNRVRAEVGVGTLKWNCDLAKFSQNWAVVDTFEHSTDQQRSQIISGGLAGENLALDSGSTATMEALNKGWIDEKLNYTYSSNTCAADKVCGHYTQMVWRATNEIGCGIIRNSKKLGAEYQSSYLVCTYYPGGNTAGEKPY